MCKIEMQDFSKNQRKVDHVIKDRLFSVNVINGIIEIDEDILFLTQ